MTSTVDAMRQRKSENKPLPSSAEEPNGRTARNPTLGLLQLWLASPRVRRHGQDSGRPRQWGRPACSTRRIVERGREQQEFRASSCGHTREPVGGH